MHFFNRKEQKPLLHYLRDHYGSTHELVGLFHMNSKQKVYFAPRSVEAGLFPDLHIKNVGFYLGQWKHNHFRFSLDGAQHLGPFCTKQIVTIPNESVATWFTGEDLPLPESSVRGFVIVKNGNDFIGGGRVADGVLHNFVSKNRRIKVLSTPDPL